MKNRTHIEGFTLVELLVSMTVVAIILFTVTQLVNTLRGTIARTSASIEEFRDARTSFESITRRLSQATLNAYDDLDPTKANASGAAYIRASELRFISGDADTLIGTGDTNHPAHPTHAVFFQAPLGFTTSTANLTGFTKLLNTCGYFIEWDSDKSLRPPFLPTSIPYRYRYRMMEFIEPSEKLSIYSYTSGPASGVTPRQTKSWTYTGRDWFQKQLAVAVNANPPRPVHAVAENVVLLALLPMVAAKDAKIPPGGEVDGTSTDIVQKTNYLYDSSVLSGTDPETRNQLPPLVRVIMIAVDEQSFLRYQAGRSSPATDPASDLQLSNTDPSQKILVTPDYTTRTADLAKVTGTLTARRIGYRIFSAAVPLTPN